MRKEYQYKLQGDGRDSWIVSEYNAENVLISRYMVFEDPIQPMGTALKAVLDATTEEIVEIKNVLGI